MVWTEFHANVNRGRDLPIQRRYVLVQIAEAKDLGMPPSVAVGYLRHAAGDVLSPYFVVPGFGRRFVVTHFCDCLGNDFYAPLWKGEQVGESWTTQSLNYGR